MSDLKEMCDALKKEKAEAERKLGNVRGVGYSIFWISAHFRLLIMICSD